MYPGNDVRQNRLAWGLLLFLSLIWGSSFILIKKGLIAFDAGQVGSLRIIAAAVFLLPFAIQRMKRAKRKHFVVLLTLGFTGSLIPAFLFAMAQTRIDSAIAGALNAITPFWVIMLGALFFYQKINLRIAIGLFVGFAGTTLLVIAGKEGLGNVNLYGLFVIAATVCYGLNLNLIKFKLSELDAITITSVSLVMTGPIAILYLLASTDFMSIIGTGDQVMTSFGAVVLLGVLGTAVALVLFNKLVLIKSPVFASSVTYLIPIVAVAWGIIDGEKIVTGQLMGMGLILAGVFIANRIR
ncbi:MAG: DMT family transporter [Bacteroidetes bacterium]|nr:DMT family transporter [Bacteroidota bacterium]MCH8231817.1 DMT family transporter [Bacteroidota bacterium]